ncbi:MAG: acetyl-CoA decarbonylase/synthase complex subunit gamma [Dehalococcoidia bacterium]|nr:acetyl-CoA decarbonylase/synthase complex subunit gamma [Dehalococcoidia bacterium]
MAIKGTDIVKKLPEGGKKNCKQCGLPTCFAFAMKLASGGVSLDKCPYLAAEVKAELADALAPPVKPVTVGTGATAFTIGDEQVMYRHEKTFVHQPALAVMVSDDEPEADIDDKISKLKELQFTWVGKTLKADMLAVRFNSGDRSKYEALVKKACNAVDCPLLMMAEDTDALLAAHSMCADRYPALYPVTAAGIEKVIAAVKTNPATVVIKADNVEDLALLTLKLKENGIENIVMDPGSRDLLSAVRDQTLVRRASLKQSFRPLGYPTIGFPCFMTQDRMSEIIMASMFIIKYAGIIVLSHIDAHTLLPVLAQRLNIYTDPRIPMSMEENIYPVNNPDAGSPVLITSNWALTYFLVSSEVEASKVPAWLLVKEAGGLGILTAWAAGKFSGDTIAPFVKKSGIEGKVNHRRLVIPGKVARIRGELMEGLPEWDIIVGPGDANEIPGYLPKLVKSWNQ